MGSPIRRQLWEVATGLTAGVGLGLLYELLRPLLGCRRRVLRLAAQFGYLLFSFAWIFLAGQLGGRGGEPLYLLICAAGWLLIHFLFGAARRGRAGKKSAKGQMN